MQDNKEYLGYADRFAEVDLLGGNKYYEGLSQFIMTCETPMTISIQGDWGTGKTTALNLIQKRIEETDKRKYQVLWFRTWQYSKFGMEENMTLALMSNLYHKLAEIAKSKNIKTDSMKLPLGKFLTEGITTVVDAVGGGRAADKCEGVLNALVGVDDIIDVSRQLEELKEKIQNCIDSIVQEDERLIIFIDDLDRLEPRVAIELLEGLKIFLDCGKCVYVLAIDSNVVYQGVKSKYGEEFGEEKSKKFFDKIIQVPFNLPVNQYDMNRYVGQFLEKDADVARYSRAVTKILGTNPRSIKRAFNLLELHELILGDNLKDETDRVNLFTILLFQMSNEKAYCELVEAAKVSSEAVCNKMNEKEYEIIKEALGLSGDDFGSEEWTGFIELLIDTSKIAMGAVEETQEVEYEQDTDSMERIMSGISSSLKKSQLNSSVINYVDENDRKRCSFRKVSKESFNIVIYSKGDAVLELPSGAAFREMVESGKVGQSVSERQLGYFKSEKHITFVNVQNCTNHKLIESIMKFYGLYD